MKNYDLETLNFSSRVGNLTPKMDWSSGRGLFRIIFLISLILYYNNYGARFFMYYTTVRNISDIIVLTLYGQLNIRQTLTMLYCVGFRPARNDLEK